MDTITRIWIEDSCISCQACVHAMPEVFALPEDKAVVLGAVRADGRSDDNLAARSELTAEARTWADAIREAAAGCPVEVIRVA